MLRVFGVSACVCGERARVFGVSMWVDVHVCQRCHSQLPPQLWKSCLELSFSAGSVPGSHSEPQLPARGSSLGGGRWLHRQGLGGSGSLGARREEE